MRAQFHARLDPNAGEDFRAQRYTFGTAEERDAFVKGAKTGAGWADAEALPRDDPGRPKPYAAQFYDRDRSEERSLPPRTFRFVTAAERDAFVKGVQAGVGWLDPRIEAVDRSEVAKGLAAAATARSRSRAPRP